MQGVHANDDTQVEPRAPAGPLLPRRSGTIPVTVRLDPPRYDRLKRLVLRLSTTGQSIIQTGLAPEEWRAGVFALCGGLEGAGALIPER